MDVVTTIVAMVFMANNEVLSKKYLLKQKNPHICGFFYTLASLVFSSSFSANFSAIST